MTRKPNQGVREMDRHVSLRKGGRPRAIDESSLPFVLSRYDSGLGYRAIARELAKQGLSVDWSTVRRVIKAHQDRAKRTLPRAIFDTILPLGYCGEMTRNTSQVIKEGNPIGEDIP